MSLGRLTEGTLMWGCATLLREAFAAELESQRRVVLSLGPPRLSPRLMPQSNPISSLHTPREPLASPLLLQRRGSQNVMALGRRAGLQ